MSKKPKPKPGRPAVTFTPDQIDEAKALLGRKGFPSRCADALAGRYGISRPTAYKLIDAAREQAVAELQRSGRAGDPLTAMSLFYQAVVFDEDAPLRERIAAGNGLVKLLALDRVTKSLGAEDVDKFFLDVLGRRAARLATAEGEDE